MAERLKEFSRKKEFLICVDSDGCAMDTMDIKHIRCFGPCMVREWGLERWQTPILDRWNEINLYTMTRGINRFCGLAMALREIHETYCPIDGIREFEAWTRQAATLSGPALREAASATANPCFFKALSWSNQVNSLINDLSQEDRKPFEGVAQGLEAAREFADVALVSSANPEAVVQEWEHCGLLDYVDVLCCQDAGTKAHCIGVLRAQGYDPKHILMVGDAPGDQRAAAQNGVYFYPILVKEERKSWREFKTIALNRFRQEDYDSYGAQVLLRFLDNLGQEPE